MKSSRLASKPRSKHPSSFSSLLEVVSWSFIWAVGTGFAAFVVANLFFWLVAPWLQDRPWGLYAPFVSMMVGLGACGIGGLVSLLRHVRTVLGLPAWCHAAHAVLVVFVAFYTFWMSAMALDIVLDYWAGRT